MTTIRFFILIFSWPLASTLGHWTWISGDSIPGSTAVLGGDPLAICPSARDTPMEIIQSSGKLVLFGGSTPERRMGDLWKYDIDRRIWNCTKGNVDRVTTFSLYGGLLHTFHISNTPSSRADHEISVIQLTNELLLFGGYNGGFLNDLWQFSFSLNQWKLISGSAAGNQPGVYGTQGTSNANNIPGGRRLMTMQYSSILGDVVVFGGMGNDANTMTSGSGALNDIWRYSMLSKQWTWIKGASLFSQSREVIITSDHHGSNSIGPTSRHSGKLQPETGNLIIATSGGLEFQLWSFSFALNAWAVLFSSPSVSYGVVDRPDKFIWPGASQLSAMEFFPDGKAMFFGFGDAYKGDVQFRSNDLWIFNMTSLEWTFARGSQRDQALASYGLKGEPDRTNIPGGRTSPGLVYDAVRKLLFLNGGLGEFPRAETSDYELNDLWVYNMTDLHSIAETRSTVTDTTERVMSRTSLASSAVIHNSPSSLARAFKSIIWIAIAVSAVCGLFAAACLRRTISKRQNVNPKASEPTEMSLSDSVPSELVTYSSSIGESGTTTMVGTFMVYSLPGFLAFKDGLEFRADQKLASGGAGDVYLGTAFSAKLLIFGKFLVVKRIRELVAESEELTRFQQEVSITNYLQGCRNIVRMLGYCEVPPSLLLKYYPLGSLKDFIMNEENEILYSMLISFCKDISIGIQAIHKAGFAHCDLKPDNILVDIDSETKLLYCVITDFGIACVLDGNVLQVEGIQVANRAGLSRAYASPEIFMNFRAKRVVRNCHGDIYALGVIINELMCRQKVYGQ